MSDHRKLVLASGAGLLTLAAWLLLTLVNGGIDVSTTVLCGLLVVLDALIVLRLRLERQP